VKYSRLPDLLNELAMARGMGTYPKAMKQYKGVDLLIFDEWLLHKMKGSERREVLPRCAKMYIYPSHRPNQMRVNPDRFSRNSRPFHVCAWAPLLGLFTQMVKAPGKVINGLAGLAGK
jgi:hypothetical protein